MRIEFKNKVYEGSNGRKSVFDSSIPENAQAVIIFIHGYKGYKDWGAWNLMETYFIENNFGFIKFNLSHNGGTIDNPIDFPDLKAFGENTYSYELNDLNTIIDESARMVKQECELDIPIYLLGHSRGGGVSILAAENQNVSKIASLAGISDIGSRFPDDKDALRQWEYDGVMYIKNGRTKQEMPHFFSFYEDFKRNEATLNIKQACENLVLPFMQIHGDMDLAVSISEGQAIANWTETDLVVIKGAEHTFGATHPWESNELPPDLKAALDKIRDFFNAINE